MTEEESSVADTFESFDFEAFLESYQEYMTEEVEVTRSRQVLRELLFVLAVLGTGGAFLLLYLGYYVYKVKQYADREGIDLYSKYQKVEDEE